MIDYVVDYMKANGKPAPKVFKCAKKKIASGEILHFSKKRSLKPMTTRKHYPGKHFISLMINGKVFGKKQFMVSR